VRLDHALRLVRAPDDADGLCEYWYPESTLQTRITTKTQRTQRRTKKGK
jgi:hypothetical protein